MKKSTTSLMAVNVLLVASSVSIALPAQGTTSQQETASVLLLLENEAPAPLKNVQVCVTKPIDGTGDCAIDRPS